MNPAYLSTRSRNVSHSGPRTRGDQAHDESAAAPAPGVDPAFRDAWAKAVAELGQRGRAS
jgi:hypothetical protein